MTIAKVFYSLPVLLAALALGACGGSDPDDDGGNIACPGVYQPVCGLAGSQPPLRYETFSNSCHATAAGASVSFDGECGELEGIFTQALSAVIIHTEQEDLPDNAAGVIVQNADFAGHDLNLTLRHSGGCGDHSFELHTALPFMESHPLQINASLIHETEDTCEAVVTSEITIDLRPLAEIHRQQYQQSSGEIYIGDFGLYQF